jgi:hypothetical protein
MQGSFPQVPVRDKEAFFAVAYLEKEMAEANYLVYS